MPSSPARFARAPQPTNWYLLSSIILAIILIASSVGLVLFQTTLKEDSQDLRQQAMVADGKIELSFNPVGGSSLTTNQEQTIELKINTHNYPINGVQLAFNIISNGLSATPELQVTTNSLQTLNQQVEQVTDGYLVSLETIVPSGAQYASSQPVTFATLKVKPSLAGQLSFNFDVENSVVTIRNASPVVDELRTIPTVSYPVVNPATGGVTSKQCNESCSSNADCQANYRCYDTGSSDGKRCRLVTNVTSTSCASLPDQGIQRSCNEYCADSRECGSGFTCYFNRCRQPDNVESSTCQLSSNAQRQAIVQSCNQTCSANRDCATNMRCYNGSCRLATNPSSTSCTATTSKSVSSTVYQKGGPTPDTQASPSGTATQSGSILTPNGTNSAGLITPSSTPTPSPSPVPAIEDDTQENMLTSLLPQLLLGAGILILLIVLTFIISRLLRGNRRPPQPPPMTKSQADSPYEKQLEERISALRQESQPVTRVQPVPVTPAPLAPQPQFRPTPEPVAVQPQPQPQPAAAPTSKPETPVFDRTTPTTTAAQSPARSSMLDRIRNKGITPPGIDQS